MGNSKLRQSSGGESVDIDDTSDINTVNAIASVSDYNADRAAQQTIEDRATLDAVEEGSTGSGGGGGGDAGSDVPVQGETEMVDQRANGTS